MNQSYGCNKSDDICNSAANWRLVSGDLTDSISFESSYSTNVAKPESDDGVISVAVDHVAKPPLLLLPPFPDSEPCEITITFAQEHELRQVYIRSSGRVYEVYYTKKRRNDKEYLCTVRCGIAKREEEQVFQIPLTESPSSKEPAKVHRVNDNGNAQTNEDDWVEVKSRDNEKDLLLMSQLRKQDFFEATAEINDAEPCISITLRLLSLQDKGCALVDEVYVFADPIDQTESEQEEASGTRNSSSSSLMAMFMPTLLQLSRGKELDRQVSDKLNDSGKIVNDIQQETNAADKGVSSPVLVNALAKDIDEIRLSGAEIKPAIPCNNVENILHQLVNKVSCIETMLTRFEDQILKPINSIDARLQLVEKKLEQLGKSFESELLVETKTTHETNTDIPQLISYAKTSAPDSYSIDNSEDHAGVLPNNKNIFTESVEQGSENNLISGNEVISAETEISNEVMMSAESVISNEVVGHSFEVKPKRSLSINDALASALAGLLSSTSITVEKYSQALVTTAPEFSNEDDMEMERPNGTHPDTSQVATEELGNTFSASESPTSSQNEPGITLYKEDDSQEMSSGVSEKFGDSIGEYDDAETTLSIRKDDFDKDILTSRNLDSSVCELQNPNVTTKEREGESKMDDVLKSVLDFRCTTSRVDFLTPLFDVKFNSDKKVLDSKCFFEALLKAESKTVKDCKYEEAFDDKLISMEDEEEVSLELPIDTLSCLEMDDYETNEMHLQFSSETSTASLI